MTRVALAAVAFDAGTQVRAAIDVGLVAEYAEAMTDGAMFPPIVLFHDGNQHYLADGFHRFMAAQRIDLREIDADVRPGTKDDALWFALGANRKNGKRLSDTDKRHAIVLALQTWPERSGREIAEQVGCANTYVSRIREEVCTRAHLPDRVTGRDGKRYPATRTTRQTSDAPPTGKSKAAIEARRATMRQMAAEGHTRAQVADAVGMTVKSVSNWAADESVSFPADAVTSRSRRLDTNRVVAVMAETAEHLTDEVPRIDFADLDRAQCAEWIVQLKTGHRALGAFIRQLEKEIA